MDYAVPNPMQGLTRILVVDDDAPTLRMIEFILQSEGYEVVGAANGMAATSQCIDEQPDLLLLNVQLPDSNGFDVYAHLQELGYSGPVVFVTARPDIAEVLTERRLNVAGYLVKPLYPDEVVVLVRRVLQTRREMAVRTARAQPIWDSVKPATTAQTPIAATYHPDMRSHPDMVP